LAAEGRCMRHSCHLRSELAINSQAGCREAARTTVVKPMQMQLLPSSLHLDLWPTCNLSLHKPHVPHAPHAPHAFHAPHAQPLLSSSMPPPDGWLGTLRTWQYVMASWGGPTCMPAASTHTSHPRLTAPHWYRPMLATTSACASCTHPLPSTC
jgi:hypothetical protein